MVSQAKASLDLLIPSLPLSFSVYLTVLQDQMQGQLQDVCVGKAQAAVVSVHYHQPVPCCRRKGVKEISPPVPLQAVQFEFSQVKYPMLIWFPAEIHEKHSLERLQE